MTTHTFTVTVDMDSASSRELEAVDTAVLNLKALAHVTVSGWCDDDR